MKENARLFVKIPAFLLKKRGACGIMDSSCGDVAAGLNYQED
jgi:hypothetical protein